MQAPFSRHLERGRHKGSRNGTGLAICVLLSARTYPVCCHVHAVITNPLLAGSEKQTVMFFDILILLFVL